MWTGLPSAGVRTFSALPAQGVRSRLFFTPADLPAMRNALLDWEGGLPHGWKMSVVGLRGQDPAHLLGVTSYRFVRDAVATGYDYSPSPLLAGAASAMYKRLSMGDTTVDLSHVKLLAGNVADHGLGRRGHLWHAGGRGLRVAPAGGPRL